MTKMSRIMRRLITRASGTGARARAGTQLGAVWCVLSWGEEEGQDGCHVSRQQRWAATPDGGQPAEGRELRSTARPIQNSSASILAIKFIYAGCTSLNLTVDSPASVSDFRWIRLEICRHGRCSSRSSHSKNKNTIPMEAQPLLLYYFMGSFLGTFPLTVTSSAKTRPLAATR